MARFFDYVGTNIFWIVVALALVAFVVYLAWLIWTFTRPLDITEAPRNEECYWICSDDDLEKVNRIVRHGYIVTCVALLLAALPPIVLSTHPALKAAARDSAIGLVMGCQTNTAKLVTYCGDGKHNAQWLLNIGGHVSRVDATESVSPAPAAATQGEPVMEVQGGLVVPLYLVVISLLGGAVGITRRLPEYQRRGSRAFTDLYLTRQKAGQVAENEPGPMDAARVREAVVFQIMQVFSAPLVAITAFSLIAAQTTSSVVLIAFASGFSTEAVLLLIRNAVERIGKIGATERNPAPSAKAPDADAGGAAAGGAASGGAGKQPPPPPTQPQPQPAPPKPPQAAAGADPGKAWDGQ